jgi:hypothetical protein
MKKEEAVQSGRSAAGASAAAASVVSLLTNFEKWEVVVRRFAIAAMALGVGFSSSAFSQGRTIEETLVLKDPTVSEPGKWKVGGAAEYWYIKGKLNIYDQNNNKVGEEDIQFNQPGFNLFAGYGDWTLQGTHRNGTGDLNAKLNTGTAYTGKTDQTDNEFTLRYLIRSWSASWVTPYAIFGYTSTDLKQEYTQTAGPGWACSPNANLTVKKKFSGPEAGLGGIFPFSETFGMRLDVRLAYYSGTKEEGNCQKRDGNGWGGSGTLTGYANLPAGFNLQAGGKFTGLNAGTDVGYLGRAGLFGMLGWSHTF